MVQYEQTAKTQKSCAPRALDAIAFAAVLGVDSGPLIYAEPTPVSQLAAREWHIALPAEPLVQVVEDQEQL